MIRTQISLFEADYELAKQESSRQGVSLAEFVRRALRSALPKRDEKPWMRYAGFVESGDAHSSQHIDDVIYGKKN
ncbi:MAG: hypothetical protein WCK42_05010 [Myxococcaceae bacterium]